MAGPPTGGAIGDALATLFAKTAMQVKAASTPNEIAARDKFVTAFMERGEAEFAPLMRDMLASLSASDELPPEFRALVERATGPTAQFDWLLQLGMAVSMAISLIFRAGEPLVQGVMNELWQDHPNKRVPAEAAAMAAVRGIVSEDAAALEASAEGFDHGRFGILLALAGGPPGIQELLAAYRRGIIDVGTLEHGIKQSNLRNEWIPTIKALRYSPMPLSAAINAVVQNHISEARGRKAAQENGLDPDDWQAMLDVAGNPPGNETLLQMVNRGIISGAQAEQGLRESALKNKWIPAVMRNRFRRLEREQITMALQRGVMDTRTASSKLQELGFTPEDATFTINEALARKTSTERDLAKSEILNLYLDRAIKEDKARGLLIELGYDKQEANLLIALADHARQRKFKDSAITRIRTKYVARFITRQQAGSELDALQVPADQRSDLLEIWDIEREITVPRLSVAQYQGLLKREVISQDDFVHAMRGIGYTEEDAINLLILSTPASKPKAAQ